MDNDFIGKAALQRIFKEGVTRKQVGLVMKGAPLQGPNTTFWEVKNNDSHVGKVTSAIYSPRLKQNIALAMVASTCAAIGSELEVVTGTGSTQATIVDYPFYDPKKKVATS